jgi:hypothetical protein
MFSSKTTDVVLKPQDLFVVLKIVALATEYERTITQAKLARQLNMSLSVVHESLQRASACGLYNKNKQRVLIRPLFEFLTHGVRYAFPAQRGGLTPGIPTASAAPPLASELAESALEWPPVWPSARGTVRGYSILPLYKSAPDVAFAQPLFYELLALVDALREGRPRERRLAEAKLQDHFAAYQRPQDTDKVIQEESRRPKPTPNDFRVLLDTSAIKNGLQRLPGAAFPGMVSQGYQSTLIDLGYKMESDSDGTTLTIRVSPLNPGVTAVIQHALQPGVPVEVHEGQLRREVVFRWKSRNTAWEFMTGSHTFQFTKSITNEELAAHCIHTLLSPWTPQ